MKKIFIVFILLLTCTPSFAQQTKVQKSNGAIINPATSEDISALRSAVIGSVINTAGTATVSGSVTATPASGSTTTVQGSVSATVTNSSVTVNRQNGSTPTLTNVVTSITSTTCLSANSVHKGRVIENESTNYLYVKYGATASSTSYTWKLGPYRHLVLDPGDYAGRIDCILSSGTGTAVVTEVTQ